MTDRAHQMSDLAEKLAREHALDFTLASLQKLEAIIATRSVDVETTRIWGAYLGETIRRQRPEVTRWIDGDTAALQIADRTWFPLSKVEKFQTNGPEDSIAGFAAAALAFAPVVDSTDQQERDRAYRASQDAELDVVAKTLLADLSAENVCRLSSAFLGHTPRSLHGQALRRIGLTVDHLMPLLGEAPRGRAWKLYPGRDAAMLVAILVYTGVAPREATNARMRQQLASRAKSRRMYAAFALAYSELQAGRTEVALELLHARDRATVDGAWEAVGHLAGLVRLRGRIGFDRDPAPMMMQALVSDVHGRVPHDERVEVLRGRPGFKEPFARMDGVHVEVPRRTVAEWMHAMQAANSSLAVQSTPVTDEDSLEYGADSCSPRYGQFLRAYGAVRIAGERGIRLAIQADVDEVEIDSYELLRFATIDGEPVYFLRDDAHDDDEAPVVTVSDGELAHHGEFERWLVAGFARIAST